MTTRLFFRSVWTVASANSWGNCRLGRIEGRPGWRAGDGWTGSAKTASMADSGGDPEALNDRHNLL